MPSKIPHGPYSRWTSRIALDDLPTVSPFLRVSSCVSSTSPPYRLRFPSLNLSCPAQYCFAILVHDHMEYIVLGGPIRTCAIYRDVLSRCASPC